MAEVALKKLAGCRVFVTRPLPDAVVTSAKLEALGYVPVMMPISETVATNIALPTGQYSAIAVTSANALRHADDAQLADLKTLQLYAVGEKTAIVARESGFETVYAGDGWGLNLGKYVAAHELAGSHILYLTGKVRRSDFEQQLEAAGVKVTVAETYDTHAIHYNDEQLAAIMSAGLPDIILLYSAVAAQQFAQLDKQTGGALLNSAKFIFCLSKRIAAELPEICQTRVHISDTPDEDALLHLLAIA